MTVAAANINVIVIHQNINIPVVPLLKFWGEAVVVKGVQPAIPTVYVQAIIIKPARRKISKAQAQAVLMEARRNTHRVSVKQAIR